MLLDGYDNTSFVAGCVKCQHNRNGQLISPHPIPLQSRIDLHVKKDVAFGSVSIDDTIIIEEFRVSLYSKPCHHSRM